LEWVTPGHPLFEVIRESTVEQFQDDLKKGSVFYDLNIQRPCRLDVFSAAIVDGLGHILHRKLFVVSSEMDGTLSVRQPTVFLDIILADHKPSIPDNVSLPSVSDMEQYLVKSALNSYLAEVQAQRVKETDTIARHLDLSLTALIDKQNIKLAEYIEAQQRGDTNPYLASNIAQTENRILELNNRLDMRKANLDKERHCTISFTQHLATAWVLPYPEKDKPQFISMVSDSEIEKIAVQKATEHEESLGYVVQSVENENRGFDLISRKPHPEDPHTAIDVKFIEVKGRSQIGDVALTSNEFKTAQRLKKDYYLYVVYNCSSSPELHMINDPALLGWQPVVKVEHYQLKSDVILNTSIK